IAKSVDADQVSVLLVETAESGGRTFRIEAEFSANGRPTPASNDILEWVASTSEPLMVTEGANTNMPSELTGVPRAGAVLYLPMITNGALVGILRVKKAGAVERFPDAEVEMLSIESSQAAIAVHNALLMRDLESGYLDALGALANALETRDIEARGHTERLSRNAIMISKQLGLPVSEVEA